MCFGIFVLDPLGYLKLIFFVKNLIELPIDNSKSYSFSYSISKKQLFNGIALNLTKI